MDLSLDSVARRLVRERRPSTLMFRDVPPDPLPPVASLRHQPVLPSPGAHPAYPWENLTFEGGGAKGYAYIGAIEVLEEEGVYPHHIRRVAGTSVGSLLAMFAGLGASSAEMKERVPADLEALVMDGAGGRAGSLVRGLRTRGLHPGLKTLDFLGEALADWTGSPDVTFAQFHERTGRELCVTVTNVTRMMTEYCHPKTTPNLPVRLAVRMSMSLPALLQPVILSRQSHDQKWSSDEIYVDGGLLCNNPIHAFDGWWLSMEPGDSFLRRLRPLSNAHDHYPRSARFAPANDQTLGFTLFADRESDLTRTWVSDRAAPVGRPDTAAARRHQEEIREVSAIQMSQKPLQDLVEALDDADLDADGQISKEEFARCVASGGLSSMQLINLFGTDAVDDVFGMLDRDGSGYIDFAELVAFIERLGVDVTTQLVGFPARPPHSIVDFALNLLLATSRDLVRANHNPADRSRTVPIDTDYISTQAFDLEPADLVFLVESARRHTRAFLDAWREQPRE